MAHLALRILIGLHAGVWYNEEQHEQSERRARIPPGQYLERGFPVLSAGPTPHTPLATWDFSIVGEVDQPKRWTWDEFQALPREALTRDIHCVTKRSEE